MNAPEALHILDRDAIAGQVNDAIAGWMAKHPNHTAAERAEATDELTMRIMTSRTKDKFLNSKANRQIRKAHVAQAAKEQGLVFASVKEVVDKGWKEGDYPAPRNLIEELIDDLMHTMVPNLAVRTATFCFKQTRIEDGRMIRIDFSIALQNPRDVHDGLVAKEYAVSRMLSGEVLYSYHIGIAEVRDFGELANELASLGATKEYASKYL